MKLIKSRKPRNLMNIYRLYLKSFPKNERKPFPFCQKLAHILMKRTPSSSSTTTRASWGPPTTSSKSGRVQARTAVASSSRAPTTRPPTPPRPASARTWLGSVGVGGHGGGGATKGAWDVVPALLDNHGCPGVDSGRVVTLLDAYVSQLATHGAPHTLARLVKGLRYVLPDNALIRTPALNRASLEEIK